MGELKLTEQQHAAVFDRGGSLLVSAAAGSGKTKVLVERVFSYLTQEHANVDDFLIITYTRAAAAELRARLASELAARVAETPEDRHLRRQMFRVYQADIKTVDGFCASLLREHIHLLEPVDGRCLTPDFRVLDEAEAQLLRERALERTMETFYQDIENGDEEAAQLAGTLGAGRDDKALTALVLELHSKIQSHPYPEKWLRAAAESWRQLPSSLADSDYGRTVMEDTVRRALFWAGQLERAVAAMEGCEPVYKANAAQFLAAAAELRRYEQAFQEGWDAMGRVQPVLQRAGTVKNGENDEAKAAAKAVREKYPVTLTADAALLLARMKDAELAPLETVAEDVGVDPTVYYTTRTLGQAFLEHCDPARMASFAPLFAGSADAGRAALAALLPNTFLQALVWQALTAPELPEVTEHEDL